MKISKLFHWLYASLMFLPLLVAPIFAIYSHRHEINDYSIQVQETKVVDFNQLVPNEIQPLYYFTFENNGDFVVNEEVTNTTVFNGGVGNNNLCSILTGHYYYLNIVSDFNSPLVFNFYQGTEYGNGSYVVNFNYDWVFVLGISTDVQVGTYSCYINIIDLTQMFGVGNEPSKTQFETWYPIQYYSYTLSDKQLLKTGNYITYDDTDIGSQFIYDLYNTTDKYLNFDSVFNLYQVNDWINLNVFNGSVPLVWYIIWHYLDYWLLLSIFWLCFDVLIYVPQLAHRWLDKASLE